MQLLPISTNPIPGGKTAPARNAVSARAAILAAAALAAPVASGALVVTPNTDASQLASSLLGTGVSIIGDPSYFGGTESAGFFTGGLSAGLEFDSGILFSSGRVVDVVGPNDSNGTSSNLGLPGDSDLSALVGRNTNDAAGLIFNFETTTGNLFFNFIFGSEEYPEYVNSSYNDVFAFFLILDADPETPGHQPGTVLNLAVVPGTEDIISIQSINDVVPSNQEYYRNNEAGTENHELDGRTTTLTAVAEDIGPGEHQIKIAIADTSDSALDSVVFLQAGTFGGQAPPPVTPGGGALSTLPFLIGNRQIETVAVAGGYQDINSRLFRLRSGFRGVKIASVPAPVPSGKGGSAKSGPVADSPTYIEVTRPWEVFGSVSYQTSDFERSRFGAVTLPGYDLDLFHGTVGVEYDINANFSVGAAFIGTDGDADFENGNKIDVQRYGVGIYGSYYREDAIQGIGLSNAFYADLLYGYSEGDYDIRRATAAGRVRGSTDSATHLIELNTGLNFTQGDLRHGPILGLAWQDGKVNGFTDKAGLRYGKVDVESLVSSVGYQVSYAIQTGAGLIIPQFRAAWEHEFEDQSIRFLGAKAGNTSEDVAALGAGVLWQFHESVYATLDYQARLSSDVDTHQVTLRLGVAF